MKTKFKAVITMYLGLLFVFASACDDSDLCPGEDTNRAVFDLHICGVGDATIPAGAYTLDSVAFKDNLPQKQGTTSGLIVNAQGDLISLNGSPVTADSEANDDTCIWLKVSIDAAQKYDNWLITLKKNEENVAAVRRDVRYPTPVQHLNGKDCDPTWQPKLSDELIVRIPAAM